MEQMTWFILGYLGFPVCVMKRLQYQPFRSCIKNGNCMDIAIFKWSLETDHNICGFSNMTSLASGPGPSGGRREPEAENTNRTSKVCRGPALIMDQHKFNAHCWDRGEYWGIH